MITFFLSVVRNTLFACAILVLGALVSWDGTPISEHLVRWTREAGIHAWVRARTADAESLIRDARQGQRVESSRSSPSRDRDREKIETSERNRLRNILRKERSGAEVD